VSVVGSVRPSLRFEILGPVRAIRGNDEIDLGPAKQRAVLAVLLLSPGRAVTTSQIVDAVWGEEPPENGANVVQKYIAGLRRVLDPDRSPRTPGELLALTPAGYLLHIGAGALDVEQFRAGLDRAATERAEGRLTDASRTLRHALGLWRGEAVGGHTGLVFDAARNRLTELHATAWESWAEIELERGRHSVLVPDLVRLTAEFPLREGLRALLMLALHRGGRQAEALNVFRDARRHLDDEFGVEPGERLQEVHRRILRNDPTLSPSPAGSPSAGSPSAGPASPAVPGPPQAHAPRPRTASAPAHPPWVPVPYVPPPAFEPRHTGPSGGVPQPFPAPPRTSRIPMAVQIIAAVLVPIFTCGLGSWIVICWLGVTRRAWGQVAAAAGYAAGVVGAWAVVGANATPPEATEISDGEALGALLLVGLVLTAAVHGALLAAHPGPSVRDRQAEQTMRRDMARRLLTTQPEEARKLGVGRPDLPRWFDDGGLVDINHAPGHVLASLPGISPDAAHRIVVDRPVNGLFDSPDDLVVRGLLEPAVVHRISPQLVCVPALQGAHAPPGPRPSAG
jgi:DNA-binding SARP family transcriptional activator